MAIRRIVTQEEEILYKKSRVVTDFNDRLHQLLDDMKDTLAQARRRRAGGAPGGGAAPGRHRDQR